MSDVPSPTTKLPLEVAGGVYDVAQAIMNCAYLLFTGGETKSPGRPPQWGDQIMKALEKAFDAHEAFVKKVDDHKLLLPEAEAVLGEVLTEIVERQVMASQPYLPRKIVEIRRLIAPLPL